MGFEGGMEYPTITSISPVDSDLELEELIEHEVGHNWFQGIIATNERDHPWMDEGVNTYYDDRYKEWKRGSVVTTDETSRKLPAKPELVLWQAYAKQNLDQPLSLSSGEFTQVNYFLTAYSKASQWVKQVENAIGRKMFDSCMRAYYSNWQFKHPYP